jgi:hypothetical protein
MPLRTVLVRRARCNLTRSWAAGPLAPWRIRWATPRVDVTPGRPPTHCATPPGDVAPGRPTTHYTTPPAAQAPGGPRTRWATPPAAVPPTQFPCGTAEVAYLNCSDCGLSIRSQNPLTDRAYCPRCRAQGRAVPLLRAALPLHLLHRRPGQSQWSSPLRNGDAVAYPLSGDAQAVCQQANTNWSTD